MKKSYTVFALIIAFTMLLTACGAPSTDNGGFPKIPANEVVLAPDDPNNIPGQTITTVQLGKTLQEQYDECVSLMLPENTPDVIITTNQYGVQAAKMWSCGDNQLMQSDAGLVMVASMALTKVIPGKYDDVTVYGVITIANVGKFALLVAAAYLTDVAVNYTVHQYVVSTTYGISVVWIHNSEHDVEKHVASVSAMITSFTTWVTTGGQWNRNSNQDWACKALEIAGEIVSYMLWQRLDQMILVWTANRWVTYYGPKSASSLMNVPEEIARDYRSKARIININCNNLPPMPPLAIP